MRRQGRREELLAWGGSCGLNIFSFFGTDADSLRSHRVITAAITAFADFFDSEKQNTNFMSGYKGMDFQIVKGDESTV